MSRARRDNQSISQSGESSAAMSGSVSSAAKVMNIFRIKAALQDYFIMSILFEYLFGYSIVLTKIL